MKEKTYCVVKDGKFFEGSKKDILSYFCRWWFDDKGRLNYCITGYKSKILHSYSKEWTQEEINKDAIESIWCRLKDYRFNIYQKGEK
jgi:hypothetical protein